jgi:hypothetical protein
VLHQPPVSDGVTYMHTCICICVGVSGVHPVTQLSKCVLYAVLLAGACIADTATLGDCLPQFPSKRSKHRNGGDNKCTVVAMTVHPQLPSGILSTLYVLYVVRCTLLGGFCTYPLYVSVR